MRYAIARARITGLATDLTAAAAAAAKNDDAVLRAAIEPLIDRGEDFCQSITAFDLLKSHCDDENDLPGSKALVEMIGGAPPTAPDRPFPAFDIAWRAIDADAGQTLPDRVRYHRATDDQVILLMARAEMNARRSRAPDANAQTAAMPEPICFAPSGSPRRRCIPTGSGRSPISISRYLTWSRRRHARL